MHLQNILNKCEGPKQTSILRRQDSYWQKGGILTILRDLHTCKKGLCQTCSDALAHPPPPPVSPIWKQSVCRPWLMHNIKWIYNSFKWPIIPSLWKRPRHWHSLGASRWFSESCHFSSALRRYWNLILVSELLAGWLWDSKDVLLLRSNYPPAVSFPQAQDETQKRLYAPKVIR